MISSQGDEDLDDWDFIQEIGRGSRSIVYKAVCLRGRLCSRVLAIKVPLQHTQSRETIQTRNLALQQELHHPNILAVYFLIPHLGGLAQVMEYCPLGTLAEITGHKPFAESKAILVMRGLVNALVYLHDRQIVHRAIQPTHILLDSNHTPKLSHFESATRPFPVSAVSCPPTDYTAPEILEGEQGGPPADIWSLGCVGLYMISGIPPPARLVEVDAALQHLNCHPEIHGLLSGMLRTLPSDRVSASALVLTKFSHLHEGTPAGRFGHNAHNPTLVPVTRILEDKARVRRNSLEDLKHLQLKHRNFEGKMQENKPLRRVVSDPLATKTIPRVSTAPDLASDLIVTEDRPTFPGLHLNAPKSIKPTWDSKKLHYIDASCLRPQSQMCKDAHISVLHDKRILVEFRQTFDEGRPMKAMLIDSPQNQIQLYENFLSQDLRRNNPSAQYTRETLPTDVWKYYDSASVAVENMNKRTPKLVAYSADGKLSLMMNGPPRDVEALFSPFAGSTRSGIEQPGEQDESTLRIRYSEAQGLIDVRRYVELGNGKIWTKKCMTSKFDPQETPQVEWTQLDDFEKDGLARLIKFSEACKKIEAMELFQQAMKPSVSAPGIQKLSHAPSRNQSATAPSAFDTLTPLIPRRPNKLNLKLPQKILSKPETSR